MRFVGKCGLGALLFWHAAAGAPLPAALAASRYQRVVSVAHGASGEVCATLDATTLAHAAGSAANSLYLLGVQNGQSRSVPFVLRESGVAPEEPAEITASDVRLLPKARVEFLLKMPSLPYSEVDLRLGLRDFYGVATVFGMVSGGAPEIPLGTFPIFDLTSQGLGRSTRLALAESRLDRLRVRLHIWTVDGRPLQGLSSSAVQGADVPPSREAETLYTPIAAQQPRLEPNGASVVEWVIPAQVPIERVAVELEPGFRGQFAASVTVQALPAEQAPIAGPVETIHGSIAAVQLPSYLHVNESALHYEQLHIAAPMAANLHQPVRLRVTLQRESGALPPIRRVLVQMRQRSLCFLSAAKPTAETYLLHYGDEGTPGSVYKVVQPMNAGGKGTTAMDAAASPGVATLGPEQVSNGSTILAIRPKNPRANPELLWLGVFAAMAGVGAWWRGRLRTASQSSTSREGKG